MNKFKEIDTILCRHGYKQTTTSLGIIEYKRNNSVVKVIILPESTDVSNRLVSRVIVGGAISDNSFDNDITVTSENLNLLEKVIFIQNNPFKHLSFLLKSYSKAITKFESTFYPVLKELGYKDPEFSMFSSKLLYDDIGSLYWNFDEDVMFNINIITGKLEILGEIINFCDDAISLTQEDFRNLLK